VIAVRVPLGDLTPETPLTPREIDVARLVAEGLSYAEIGMTLGISPRTVETHVHRAASKLPGASQPYRKLAFYALRSLAA
jgi:DNA-binding CsgD family transcriptional regulator